MKTKGRKITMEMMAIPIFSTRDALIKGISKVNGPAFLVFILLFVVGGSEPNFAQAKTVDQIWREQHEGQAVKCLMQNMFKEYNEAIGQPTGEEDETIETCNHDMLYMLGLCEQHEDAYSFCKSVHSYIDDHNLEQIGERPTSFSQETIDGINEYDWNSDGKLDGSDFVSG